MIFQQENYTLLIFARFFVSSIRFALIKFDTSLAKVIRILEGMWSWRSYTGGPVIAKRLKYYH